MLYIYLALVRSVNNVLALETKFPHGGYSAKRAEAGGETRRLNNRRDAPQCIFHPRSGLLAPKGTPVNGPHSKEYPVLAVTAP